MALKYLTSIDLNGNEVQNSKIQNLAADPTPLGEGHFYYNTASKTFRIYNGTSWIAWAASGHTHTAADITDFDTEVSNNTDVAANTAARHSHSNKTVLDNTTASYTTGEQTKLSGIAAGAEVNVQSDWNASSGDAQILNKPTLGTAAALNTGTAQGNIPVLGVGGKLASSVLPSYVDDVLEYANLAAFPATGESGIIYFAIDTGRMYRWSGSLYAQITSGGAVDSVNGKTGVVTLTNTDVGAAAASHAHGNITTDGKIGSTTNQLVVTTTGGAVTTEAKPTGLLPLSTTAADIKMNGTQSLGSSNTLPRADHVHPVDTSREPAIGSKKTAFNKDYGATATDVKMNGTQAVGSVDAIARIDHVHPVDTSREPAIGTKKTAFNKDYGTTVGDVKMNGTASVGTADALARIDHVHPKDTSKTGKYAATIGDGTNVSYTITHNLGTTDVTVLIYDVLSSPYAQVYTDVEITGANSITVRFATAPASGKYRVIVVG